jgi:hypothetical protein
VNKKDMTHINRKKKPSWLKIIRRESEGDGSKIHEKISLKT